MAERKDGKIRKQKSCGAVSLTTFIYSAIWITVRTTGWPDYIMVRWPDFRLTGLPDKLSVNEYIFPNTGWMWCFSYMAVISVLIFRQTFLDMYQQLLRCYPKGKSQRPINFMDFLLFFNTPFNKYIISNSQVMLFLHNINCPFKL